MKVPFTKLNGAGNDFIAIDNREGQFNLTREMIARLCHRHFGIGADGLLLVERADEPAAVDYRMRYFNSDGGEAEMCGNGARCFAQFTKNFPRKNPNYVTFSTPAGNITAVYKEDNTIAIDLPPPHDLVLNRSVQLAEETIFGHSINTGVPHFVTFTDELDLVDVARLGSALRHHAVFRPAGTNVNFATILSPGHLKIRTYERGVEAETLACGTGVVASALIYHLTQGAPSPILVDVAGEATLIVVFEKNSTGDFIHLSLQGPAETVFHGTIEI
ncbi:MAG: diaminopimelate epimerase [Methylacidiphilales bacterium]|nr:diaminopimelate epimerase [Candidatus Methylacidiphilales bacterium]MDW8348869.1 diaminopimelate epimerase [Verrucomicrobiae bacterium]